MSWRGIIFILVSGLALSAVGCNRPDGAQATQMAELQLQMQQLQATLATSDSSGSDSDVKALLQQLVSRADGGATPSSAEMELLREQYRATQDALGRLQERYDETLQTLAAALQASAGDETVAQLRSERATAREALAQERTTNTKLQGALAANWTQLIETLERSSLDLDAQKLRQDLIALRQTLEARDAELLELRADFDQAQQVVEDRDGQIASLRQEKIARQKEIDRLREQLGLAPRAAPEPGEDALANGPLAGVVSGTIARTSKVDNRYICIVEFPRGTAVRASQHLNVFARDGSLVAVFITTSGIARNAGGSDLGIWISGSLEDVAEGFNTMAPYRVSSLERVPNLDDADSNDRTDD